MKKMQHLFRGGQPPFFVHPLLGKDRVLLTRFMEGRHFSPDLVLGVAKRCSHGFPQVLLCASLREGRPFPTNFWLLCPWIDKLCASLESSSGVPALEDFLLRETDPSSWIAWHTQHAALRLALLEKSRRVFMKRYRPGWWQALARRGIGGSRLQIPPKVKCLHLQMAGYLALGWHPGEMWIREHFPERFCAVPKECFSVPAKVSMK